MSGGRREQHRCLLEVGRGTHENSTLYGNTREGRNRMSWMPCACVCRMRHMGILGHGMPRAVWISILIPYKVHEAVDRSVYFAHSRLFRRRASPPSDR